MSSSERSAERVGQAIEAFARVAETRLAASRIIEFDPATRKQLAVADTERLVQLLLQLVAQQRTLTALPDGVRIANPTDSHGGVHGVRSPDGPKVTLSPHPNRESLDAAIAPPTALLFRNRLKGTDKLTRRPGLALLDRDLSALYVDASAHSERVLRSKDARRSHISEQK